MKLAKEMLRLPALGVRGGEVSQKTRLRCRHLEGHCLRVGDHDLHALTGNKSIVLGLGEDLRVHHQMIVPELHVFSGERVAIGPLMALAKMESQLGKIVIELPALCHIRHDRQQIVRIADEVHMAYRQEVRCTGLGGVRQRIKGAAIFADAVIRHDNKRFGWDTLSKRRKISIAADLAIQCCAVRVCRERHGASGCSFKFSLFELLWVGAIRHTLHIRHGHRRAACICACRQCQ